MHLERVGDFEILASDDSEQGCKLALTERPNIILMDLEMPGADRWEVVRPGCCARAASGQPAISIAAPNRLGATAALGCGAAHLPERNVLCFEGSLGDQAG